MCHTDRLLHSYSLFYSFPSPPYRAPTVTASGSLRSSVSRVELCFFSYFLFSHFVLLRCLTCSLGR